MANLKSKTAQDLLRTMVLIRRFEEKIVEVYGAQDMKTPVHLCIGQEAVAAGVCAVLSREDYVFTTHRGHGHCLAKGMAPESLYAEFYGRATGCSRGKGGSMHPCEPSVGILGTTAIVGGGPALATGAALASVLRQDGRVAVAFFGDGASEEGTFHESLNFAALKSLPVVFVCENNFYATSSPLSARQPHPDIFRKAAGYGIPGKAVDGNDVEAVYQAARSAVKRARQGRGPSFLECKTYRWKGHVGPECDYEKGCRPKEELFAWMEKCPVEAYKKKCIGQGFLDEASYEALVRETDKLLDRALESARKAPYPKTEELYEHVYYNAEDAEDLAAFDERAAEPNLAFENVIRDLKSRGKI